MKMERVDEAIANYHKALALKPDYPDAHKNLGLALLSMGDFAAGWPEYEYRWGTKEMPARKFTPPRWDGGPLDGKTILLYGEQGLGDTIQFIRYAGWSRSAAPPCSSNVRPSCSNYSGAAREWTA